MSVSKIRPLGDRIVIKQASAEKQTKGGIFIPDSAQDKNRPAEGEVLAVGPGRMIEGTDETSPHRLPVSVNVGDLVIFRRYGAVSEVVVDGETYLVVPEGDVLGVMERA